jgi:hypothetical protein
MSRLLTSGQMGTITLAHHKRIREQTLSKWDSLGFLEGLKGHVKENIADLYQCCKSSVISTNNGIEPKKYVKKHKI